MSPVGPRLDIFPGLNIVYPDISPIGRTGFREYHGHTPFHANSLTFLSTPHDISRVQV